MKYIDADKLKAKIERLQEFNNSMSNNAINSNMRNFYDGEVDCCKQLISFIDSLQQEQPEADLDDTIRVEFDTRAKVEDGKRCVKLNWDKFSVLARHFYELGLKAKKEE